MIRTLTIVENATGEGKIEYTANGSLPIDEAGRALVLIAYNAKKPEQKQENTEALKTD